MIISRGFGLGGNTLLARGFGIAAAVIAGFMGWEEKKYPAWRHARPRPALELDSAVTAALFLQSPVEMGKLVLKSLVTPGVSLRSLVATKLGLVSKVTPGIELDSKV